MWTHAAVNPTGKNTFSTGLDTIIGRIINRPLPAMFHALRRRYHSTIGEFGRWQLMSLPKFYTNFVLIGWDIFKDHKHHYLLYANEEMYSFLYFYYGIYGLYWSQN